MKVSEHLRQSCLESTSGYLISFPQTIISKSSEGLCKPSWFPCAFPRAAFCTEHFFNRDCETGLAVTVNIPLEIVPNLIISILLDLFSLTITGCDFQGWPSLSRPLSLSIALSLSPLQALWCLIQGQGRPARHSAQTLAPFPQCTMHSSSLLWGLEEIMQTGEL